MSVDDPPPPSAMGRWEASEDRILQDNADYFDSEAQRYGELGDHDAASALQEAGDRARSLIGGSAQPDSADTPPDPPGDHLGSAGTGNQVWTGEQDPADPPPLPPSAEVEEPVGSGTGGGTPTDQPFPRQPDTPRPVVIGEQQDRVKYAASRFDADYYHGLEAEDAGLLENSEELRTAQLKHNEDWINRMREEGRLVIDTGPAEPRTNYPGPTRPSDWPLAPYEVELSVIENYSNVIRPWEDMTGTPNFPWKDDSSTYLGGYYKPEKDPAADAASDSQTAAGPDAAASAGEGRTFTAAGSADITAVGSVDTAPPSAEVVEGSASGDIPAADSPGPVNEPITLDVRLDIEPVHPAAEGRASADDAGRDSPPPTPPPDAPPDSGPKLVLVANTADDLPPEIREMLDERAITAMEWPVEVYDRVMSDGEAFEKFSHFAWHDAGSTAERQARTVPHDPGRSMEWMRPVGEGREEVFFDVMQDIRQTPRGQQLTDAEVGTLGRDFAPSDPHEGLAISREFDGALSQKEARNARYTLTFEDGAHVRYIKSAVAPQDSAAERRTGQAELPGGGKQVLVLDFDTDRSTITVAPVGGRVQFASDGSMRWGYRDRPL